MTQFTVSLGDTIELVDVAPEQLSVDSALGRPNTVNVTVLSEPPDASIPVREKVVTVAGA